MKKILSSVAVLSVLLLIGAGCATSTPETKPADQSATNDTVTPPAENPTPSEETTPNFKLSGEALGNNQVKFTWEIPSGVADPASFRLVRGPKQDPVFPGNYWYQLLGSKRQTTWINLPTGKQYFRICTFVDNECAAYSNSIEVDVK